jgi:hypothetical protein
MSPPGLVAESSRKALEMSEFQGPLQKMDASLQEFHAANCPRR